MNGVESGSGLINPGVCGDYYAAVRMEPKYFKSGENRLRKIKRVGDIYVSTKRVENTGF